MYDVIFSQGNVVFKDEIKQCDVAVKDGKIVAIAPHLEGAMKQSI